MKIKSNANSVHKTINVKTNRTLLNLLVISALVSSPLMAKTEQQLQRNDAQTTEEIGLGTGVLLGAIFGGPIGAIVTGIAGTFIAKHINAKDDIEHLEISLADQSENHQQEVALQKREFNKKLQSSEQAYQAELLALEQNYQATGQMQAENLLMSLQFSTGSSDIAPHYQEQVAVLADLLNRSPKMAIDLSGYTDMEGEESLNQNLSLARVNEVKRLLMAQGVEGNRIQTFSYGEGAPVVATAQQESSFYDRRVVLKLHTKQTQTAKNQ